MQLQDLDILREVQHRAGEIARENEANPSEEHSEDHSEDEKDSNQPEICDQKIADVIALADGSCFIPCDLGFIVDRVQQRLSFAAVTVSTFDNDDRTSSAYDESVAGVG